ncbi:Nucleotide-binding universal stress protein, UspA family [Roseovarius marisflavi]|uniref:Nucleotide-binding universal stress protein, UspA family n=1 Tax=Roseovarius marisflavi TaxID=1054996 RepID=A0A1M7B9X2_9RHOB|nr:universal stress protein [Roseovarius marisflavi]SHL51666.1 Nucleotide-binding universal stress protein, UspA family [Roseovarius marisflavi]
MTGKIIVATDGSATGNRAVDFAAALSEKFGKDLCVVHVLMYGRPSKEVAKMAESEGIVLPVAPDDATRQSAFSMRFPSAADEVSMAKAISALGDRIAEHAKQRAQDAGARNVTIQMCAGDIADEILDVAEAEKADVLVLGRRGLGRVREVLLGSVSQKVLHNADCTVVIVP